MFRLSVIVPGYNNPVNLWQRCLESILSACGAEDEIICVDDGSCDRPLMPIEDTRIKWLYLERNLGQSAARNAALKVAKGEYVAFVDSDDAVLPHAYNEAIDSLTSTDADIALFGVRTIWLKDGLMNEAVPNASLAVECLDQVKLAELTEQRLFDVVWNKVYRRSFLETHNIQFTVGICPGEDTMFVLDCVLNKAKWFFIDKLGYVYYRIDGTSLSTYKNNLVATLQFWKTKWDLYLATVGKGYWGWWPTMNYSEEWVARRQWDNIWLKGSPFRIGDRWKYLRTVIYCSSFRCVGTFVCKCAWVVVRKYFYFRPIRRWKIKYMYPNAKEWQE